MAADTTGKKKFAFRDVRDDAELLVSGRPPLSVVVNKSNPVSKKLSKLFNKKALGIAAGVSSVASAATNALLGVAEKSFTGKIAGKIKLPGIGKLGGGGSYVRGMASSLGLGAKIIEEMSPEKIRRPFKDGLSSSASIRALSLSETTAASVTQSLIAGMPLASGLPTTPREFKTAASLVKSPRFFNPTNDTFAISQKEKTVADNAIKLVMISRPEERLYSQRGLLQDELMYRLTLLAENIYAPTTAYTVSKGWGAPTILESFRAENSITSSHETGDSIDITLGDGGMAVAGRCFALARWMRDNILYDQLILCFDVSGGEQVWIHASFRATDRRRQVLTKAFNDTHTEGLHLYQWAAATAEQTALVEQGKTFGVMLADRQLRLEPIGVNTILPQESGGGLDGCGRDDGGCGTPGNIPSLNIMPQWEALIAAGPAGIELTHDGSGLFVELVIESTGPEWGHIRKDGGQIQYNGHAVDAIMYHSPTPLYNGEFYQAIDIVSSNDSPDAKPQWLPVCSPSGGKKWLGKINGGGSPPDPDPHPDPHPGTPPGPGGGTAPPSLPESG